MEEGTSATKTTRRDRWPIEKSINKMIVAIPSLVQITRGSYDKESTETSTERIDPWSSSCATIPNAVEAKEASIDESSLS